MRKATLTDLQRQVAKLQAQIDAQTPPAAPQTTLTELRRRLKAHRAEMHATPGVIALDDERTEALLLRAIEIAKAPHSATVSHADGLERSDGLTNAGLSGDDDDEAE